MSVALPILKSPPAAFPPAAPAVAAESGRLLDSHGRVIRDLRLSVTDRCNFRCTYCMDPDFRYMPKRELLSLDEYVRLVRICATLGVEKVRITGGEPTLYPHLIPLIRALSSLGIRDLAMTTNGSLMTRDAAMRWREAGLRRITLSIDSLKPDRLRAITRSDTTLDSTIRAIEAAHAAGLGPVKVNAVVMKGVNDDELADFADFAIEHGIDMRLIEFMPLDSSRAWKREDVVDAREMIARISERHTLIPVEDERPDSTSMNFRFAHSAVNAPINSATVIDPIEPQRRRGTEEAERTGGFNDAVQQRSAIQLEADQRRESGASRDQDRTPLRLGASAVSQARIGIIAPVSQPFCGACSRLRITADGKIRPCLFSTREWDVRALLRDGLNDEAIARFLVDSTWTKQASHGIGSNAFTQPERTMSAIGG